MLSSTSDIYYPCVSSCVRECMGNMDKYRLVRTFTDGSGGSAEYFDSYPTNIAPHTPLKLQVFNIVNSNDDEPTTLYSRLIDELSAAHLLDGVITTIEFCAYENSNNLTLSMLLDGDFRRDPDICEGILRTTILQVIENV